MSRREWTKEEDDWLVENYPTTPTRECAARFGVEMGNIHTRVGTINKLRGIKVEKEKLSTYLNGWLQCEDDWLIENYPLMSAKLCAKKLGRSFLSVRSRVVRLREHLGIDIPSHERVTTGERRSKILNECKGLSVVEAANKLNECQDTIRNDYKRLGLYKNGKADWSGK